MRNKNRNKNQEMIIRCDRCYAAFVGPKAMKQFNKHHQRMHNGHLSMFSQLTIIRNDHRQLNFETLEVQAVG